MKAHCPSVYHGEHLDKSSAEVRAIRLGDWGSWPLSPAALAYAALDALMPLAVLLHLGGGAECSAATLAKGLGRMPRTDVALEPDQLLSAPSERSAALDAPETETSRKRKLGSKQSAADADVHSDFFRMQRNRSTLPPNAGKKKYPEGNADALAGVCIVVSGVLDSMTRDEFNQYVARHGGRTSKSVTSKVTHLVTDHGEAGPSKLKKCSSFGIKVVGEDKILGMVAGRLKARQLMRSSTRRATPDPWARGLAGVGRRRKGVESGGGVWGGARGGGGVWGGGAA